MSAASTRSLPFSTYLEHDAMGLASLVQRGEVSAAELLNTALARTAEVNPTINAVVGLCEASAREQLKQGLPEGALSGVPFLLKDLFIDLEGTPTTSGSRFLQHNVARHDSVVAQRYRQAG